MNFDILRALIRLSLWEQPRRGILFVLHSKAPTELSCYCGGRKPLPRHFKMTLKSTLIRGFHLRFAVTDHRMIQIHDAPNTNSINLFLPLVGYCFLCQKYSHPEILTFELKRLIASFVIRLPSVSFAGFCFFRASFPNLCSFFGARQVRYFGSTGNAVLVSLFLLFHKHILALWGLAQTFPQKFNPVL